MTASIPQDVEEVGARSLDAAFKVHRTLGPGLLESVYEACLSYELSQAGVQFEPQCLLPICYGDVVIDSGLRLDLLVENKVIIELKSIETLLPIHEAQLLTYMKLANKRLGFLLNINTVLLRDGMKRLVL